MRYWDIPKFINEAARDHKRIMENGSDCAILTMALQRLPTLSKFNLYQKWHYKFHRPHKFDPIINHIVDHVGLDTHKNCHEHHLVMCLQAIRLSQFSSNPVTELTIQGSPIEFKLHPGQIILLQGALAKIESLTLDYSRCIFDCLVNNNISMPVLKRLVLISDDDMVHIDHLEIFCKMNGRHLEFLDFDFVLVFNEEINDRYCLPLAVLQRLHRIGKYCALREVKFCNWFDDIPKLEALLLGNLAYEDIKSVFRQKKN